MTMRYDLKLFLELNEEYKSKPLVKKAPSYESEELQNRAGARARQVNKMIPLTGRRYLEIGCGRGEVCRAVADTYGCEALGVDIAEYPEWKAHNSKVTLKKADLSSPETDLREFGQFSAIYSNAVWEHVRHPYSMLKAAYTLLADDGDFVLNSNLYRGPKASHRYREIYFPWPHLLFSDDVISDFYDHLKKIDRQAESRKIAEGKPAKVARRIQSAWVNQLSIADYHNYFRLIGFDAIQESFSTTPIDEAFYERFNDKLSRIPRFDLERDFIKVHLRKAKLAKTSATKSQTTKVEKLESVPGVSSKARPAIIQPRKIKRKGLKKLLSKLGLK
jgi:SAM-dependent methyltransferase